MLLLPLNPQSRPWSGKPVASPLTLLHPHTDLAHRYWRALLQPGDLVCDATAGHGQDTALLAEALAAQGGGSLWACDIQPDALRASQERMRTLLAPEFALREDGDGWAASRPDGAELKLQWTLGSHTDLLSTVADGAARLVVFNLGYLPGGDKSVVTTAETTLAAIAQAQRAVCAGGCVSATIYSGHAEGKREEEALLEYAASQPMDRWSVYHHR